MNICFLRFHRISKALLYRPYYDNQRAWLRVSGFQTTGTVVKNPFTFFYVNTNDWSSAHSYQFWSKNFTAAVGVNNDEIVKTIYSPSPSGYVEPKTAAFTGFTSTGGNTGNSSQFNVSGVYNKGYNFYTNGWKTGGTIFFPSLGYRDVYTGGSGGILSVGIDCDIWSAGALSEYSGRIFGFNSSTMNPQGVLVRSYGFSCRSVKE